VDKFADKYHDKVYDHLPAWRKKQQAQQAQNRRNHEQQQHNQPAPANEKQRSRELPENNRDGDQPNNDNDNTDMSSYAQSQAPSHAPDRRQEYRGYQDDRYGRYVQNESGYNRGLNAGPIVMRDHEAYPERTGYEVGVSHLPTLICSQN
jgi:hypothetical protein